MQKYYTLLISNYVQFLLFIRFKQKIQCSPEVDYILSTNTTVKNGSTVIATLGSNLMCIFEDAYTPERTKMRIPQTVTFKGMSL